jgi:hypothetical protein
MPAKSWILRSAILFSAVFIVWVAVSLRNDDSALSVLTRDLKESMCWSADSSTACVLKAMTKYEKHGRYDDAASVGAAWADKSPDSFMSGWIYQDISALYLKRARVESGRAEEYLKQAVIFRDKAVVSASDSPASLQRLAAISESVGDLSTAQRCVQYRNSIKLINRLNQLANEGKERLARQIRPDLNERRENECLFEWIDASTKRVRGKLSAYACQNGPPLT